MRVPSFYEEHHMFYFTLYSMNNDNEMRYFFTIVLVQFIPIQQQTVSITNDTNTINMTEYVTTITQMVSDELSMLYPTVADDEMKMTIWMKNMPYLEEELQTPVNPVTENTVTQWDSSQWFSSARYDYTQSGPFLDKGSGSPIDDLIESGTLRLLDWKPSMIEIQLGVRFVDKVQAISAVQK
ncbi:hypothetical protein M9H77_12336 [Catharanthus roseus]|uniref:Uncharacterized protein n=1 Tax=Catharanthus roseus TaxID=4058 RepID=A0ACC0BH70_CATRO|nr:hypothetical protein M9H77_12336 [Catharanthus roseus]